MTREQFISHVESTQKAFRRFLVALCCGDTALADDIAQESYIKAYLSCDSFSNLEKFNAWIFKSATTPLSITNEVNDSLSELRMQKKSPRMIVLIHLLHIKTSTRL